MLKDKNNDLINKRLRQERKRMLKDKNNNYRAWNYDPIIVLGIDE